MEHLSFIIDHAQSRVSRDRIVTIVSGLWEPDAVGFRPTSGWSTKWGDVSSDKFLTYVDPVTGTLMLTPAPLLPGWDSSSSGIYTKLTKANFTFADSSKWIDSVLNGSGRKTMNLKDGAEIDANRSAVSTASYAKNRAFVVGCFCHNSGTEKFSALECGWHSSATLGAGVGVKIWSSGEVEIYKDGEKINEGTLTGARQQGQSADNKFVEILLIPFRKRELLVLSTEGQGFTTIFDDIDESEDDPEITPAGKFWFKAPSGSAVVSCSPIKYPTSAYRASVSIPKAVPPSPGSVATCRAFSGGTGTVSTSVTTKDDADTPFTPDGVERYFRVRADLTSDGDSTPFVYAAMAEYATETLMTDDSEQLELNPYLLGATINVSEHPGCLECELRLKSADTLQSLNRLKTQSNKPFQIKLGEVVIFEGRTKPPRTVNGLYDEAHRVTLPCRSLWDQLEKYNWADETPFDTLSLYDAEVLVLRSSGIADSMLDIEDAAVTIEADEGCGSRSDWAFKADVGDTSAQLMDKFHEAYVGNWFIGERPSSDGWKVVHRSRDTLATLPLLTLYGSKAELESDPEAAWIPEHEKSHYLYRKLDEETIEPEANDIWVTGIDLRHRRPIIVHKQDSPSQDPTLPPSMRPDNWAGEIWRYGFQSPQITSQSLASNSADILAERLTPRRFLNEIECEFLIDPASGVPYWSGDELTLYGLGVWRIISMRIEVDFDSSDFDGTDDEPRSVFRPTIYCLERVDEGTAQGLGHKSVGASLEEIRLWKFGTFVSRTYRTGKTDPWIDRPPISVIEL